MSPETDGEERELGQALGSRAWGLLEDSALGWNHEYSREEGGAG